MRSWVLLFLPPSLLPARLREVDQPVTALVKDLK